IYSFTPEVGDFADGFWPPSSKIIRMCRENILQNLRLALIAGGLSQTTLENIPNIATKDGYLPFTFQKFGLNNNSNYTIAFEPIQNIAFNQLSITFSSPTLLSRYKDSIAFNIPSTTKNGDTIIFVIRTFSNRFETLDTITKIYGRPITICSENGNSFENWTSETWNTTSSTFVSKSQSITDSPNGNYNDNSTSTINYIPTIDLTSSQHAFIEFNAKWDIELEYDYAQLQISEDNGTSWKAICGAYTHGAKVIDIYDQPVYDGTQKEWIKEAINLKDFIGKKIKVRFVLKSDNYTNYDGFYFDDFKINAFNTCDYSTDVVACKSYTWNNTTYTKSGSYTYQPKSSGTCDTTWYLNLTILPKVDVFKNNEGDTLMATAKKGNFRWMDCANNLITYSTTDTSYFVPKKSGNYQLIHTLNQCMDTSNCINFTLANANINLQSIDYKISIHPNPFKEEVTISFDAPKGNKVEIELINALGMNISTLFSGTLTQNSHQLKLEKSSFDLNPGVYFIRFNVNDQHILRKLLLIE
ncbi:MAG: T9SS C-terminal target domain-containing protein, partial [Crocinitomicaceae bacterium]|nr:T9SS C-terminal target domain-containing protein [Crocinitomicaceae bacterium]